MKFFYLSRVTEPNKKMRFIKKRTIKPLFETIVMKLILLSSTYVENISKERRVLLHSHLLSNCSLASMSVRVSFHYSDVSRAFHSNVNSLLNWCIRMNRNVSSTTYVTSNVGSFMDVMMWFVVSMDLGLLYDMWLSLDVDLKIDENIF